MHPQPYNKETLVPATTYYGAGDTRVHMAMRAELTTAEVRRHEKVARFSAARATPGGARAVAWVHSRGRLDKESDDGGEDLVVLAPAPGGFPQTVLPRTAPAKGPRCPFHTRAVLFCSRPPRAARWFDRWAEAARVTGSLCRPAARCARC